MLGRGGRARAARGGASRAGMVSAVSSVVGELASELEDTAALGQLDSSAALLRELVTRCAAVFTELDGISVEALQQRVRRGARMLSPNLPDVKFLLVDDLDENLFAFEESLRRDGLTVVGVRSGASALEALLVHDFALAIIDVEMPGMDGVELAELMRGSERARHVRLFS